jgi:uncharacterized protein YdaL
MSNYRMRPSVEWACGKRLFRALAGACMIASVTSVSLPAQPVARAAASATVIVICDEPGKLKDRTYEYALDLDNLLSHFQLKAQVVPLESYTAGQLSRYQAGFFLSSSLHTRIPPVLVNDIRTSRRPFAWLGRHIGQLLATDDIRRQFGFAFQSSMLETGLSVEYKGTQLLDSERAFDLVSPYGPAPADTIAQIHRPGERIAPYVLRKGQFWYFADTPFSYMEDGGRYLVLCDLLHDILGIQHAHSARALIRIEDVSADTDPEDLTQIADVLAARQAPFQISLIPIFRDPSKSVEIRLAEIPGLIDALQYMISKGGTPVMHGGTHQWRGVSADDFEFWDDMRDAPIAGDSTQHVLRTLRFGLSECFRNSIFPVAFETPHYGASEVDYRAFRQVFSASYDRPMNLPRADSGQSFPYPVVDRYGRFVIPESLGYLPLDNPDPEIVLNNARRLRVVRDGVASFYFHPFLDSDLLEKLVDGIRLQGYHFVSVREYAPAVNCEGSYAVLTASGTARMAPRDEYWRIRQYDRIGRLVKTEVSSARLNEAVELPVNVLPQGWTAVDCTRELQPDVEPTQRWSNSWRQGWARFWEWAHGRTRPETSIGGRQAWILWLDNPSPEDAFNQQSYRAALNAAGFRINQVSVAALAQAPVDKRTVIAVPRAPGALLSATQRDVLLKYLAAGGSVIFEGNQPWLSAIGLRFSPRKVPVMSVSDPIYDMPISWRPRTLVNEYTVPEDARVLLSDPGSGLAVALAGRHGAGRFLYLAAPLDPFTPYAGSRYPNLPQYIVETFGAATPLRARRLEAYFDPSYRPGADLNRLAANWRRSGISTVYAAAWIFTREFSFPYEEFVRACHRNGVSVYAWFVFPAVTPRMWDEHPEWREKTASGVDARLSWRYSMNFQNPDCYRAAMQWMQTILRSYDWDGVNVTELNFDGDAVPEIRPERFAPMNKEVREGFRATAGFDPMQIFQPGSRYHYSVNRAALDKFMRYREDIVVDWHRRILSELQPLQREHGWEVIVTALDSLHSDTVRSALGVDTRRIVDLMKEYPFTLQVEDPGEYWSKAPDRYLRFAQTYMALVADRNRLMFDVNVVSRNLKGTSLAVTTATGTELALTIAAAASVSGRVAVYSEHTVASQDWPLLRTTLALPAQIDAVGDRQWRLSSPYPVLLSTGRKLPLLVDGRSWPVLSPDDSWLPPGNHTVGIEHGWRTWLLPSGAPVHLVSSTAGLSEVRATGQGIELRYSSPGRAVMIFDKRPVDIFVDGARVATPAEIAGAGWSAVFPAGPHNVRVVTDTAASVAVNAWGWFTCYIIGGLGALASLAMLGAYAQLKFRRFARQRGW